MGAQLSTSNVSSRANGAKGNARAATAEHAAEYMATNARREAERAQAAEVQIGPTPHGEAMASIEVARAGVKVTAAGKHAAEDAGEDATDGRFAQVVAGADVVGAVELAPSKADAGKLAGLSLIHI